VLEKGATVQLTPAKPHIELRGWVETQAATR